MAQDEQSIDTRMMLDILFACPLAYSTREGYYSVVDFLDGYDMCCAKLDLRNIFYEWLMDK